MQNETRIQMKARLARLNREYRQALAEIDGKPDGNGTASQDEMYEAVRQLYGMTILSLERRLEYGLAYVG